MYRPILLLLAALALPTAGQDLWTGHLSPEQLLLELEPIRENTTKERILAQSLEKAAESRLAKLRGLEEQGFAASQKVASQRLRLAAAKTRRTLWDLYAQAISASENLAASAVFEPPPEAESGTSFVPVQIPGITQRFGNIDLFLLACQPDQAQLDSAIAYLKARQAPTQLGQQLAEVDRAFLGDLGEAIEALDRPYASDIGRFQARTFDAASNYLISLSGIHQLERDANRILALQSARDAGKSAPFPWLSQPLGLLGTGWRCGGAPSPRIVALCLPLAKAQRDATGPILVAQVQLTLAKHRLAVKTEARERNIGSDLEVDRAAVELKVAEAQLEASRTTARINHIRYQQLLDLVEAPESSAVPPNPESLEEIQAEALAQLETLSGQPEFIYGWLKILKTCLTAQANLEIADRNLEFRQHLRDEIHALQKSTANERRRVSLQADFAQATRQSAAETLRLRSLEFAQWIAAAKLARSPGIDSGPRIPRSALQRSSEISRANETVLRSRHAQYAAYFQFQSRFVSNLERVHQHGAATDYELAQTRCRLEMARGNLETLQPDMEELALEQNLQEVIRQSPPPRDIADLNAAGSQLLAQIAGTRQRPNPGSLIVMDAMREFTQRRAGKMEPLIEKGFATHLELAEIERTSETYRLIAASERQRELAVAPAAAIIGQPRPEPTMEFPDMVLLPAEAGSGFLEIQPEPNPFPEVANQQLQRENTGE